MHNFVRVAAFVGLLYLWAGWTGCSLSASSSWDKLTAPSNAVGEFVSLLMKSWNSPVPVEEEVAGESNEFTREWVAAATSWSCGDACALVKNASVCISHIDLGFKGDKTIGVERRIPLTPNMMSSY